MVTFNEFQFKCNLILEKYYAPDEKLPSGKTPFQKAEKKGIKGDLLRKVKRGADNPNVDDSPQKGVEISSTSDKKITSIKHPKTGLTFDLDRKGDVNGKPHYGINWWDMEGGEKTPEKKRKLAFTARKMWHGHVQKMLPHGSVVSNQPGSDKHKSIYKSAGFGDPHPGLTDKDYYHDDRYNRQYAKVGREPSPKQRAKGKKSRLSPLDPPKEKQPIK